MEYLTLSGILYPGTKLSKVIVARNERQGKKKNERRISIRQFAALLLLLLFAHTHRQYIMYSIVADRSTRMNSTPNFCETVCLWVCVRSSPSIQVICNLACTGQQALAPDWPPWLASCEIEQNRTCKASQYEWANEWAKRGEWRPSCLCARTAHTHTHTHCTQVVGTEMNRRHSVWFVCV